MLPQVIDSPHPSVQSEEGEGEVVVRPVDRFAIGAIGQVCMTNNRQTVNFLHSRKNGLLVMENRKTLAREIFIGLLQQMC